MANVGEKEDFFPAIGSQADAVDEVPDSDDDQIPSKVTEQKDGLSQEDEEAEHPVTEIESLCMSCHEDGTTRLLLTTIPFFKEVIVASFRCEHCGASNNEIQQAGQIQDNGSVYTVKVATVDDLDRQMIRSEHCTVVIPELELTVPPSKGQLTTIEGFLSDVILDLEQDQPVRMHTQAEVYDKIEKLLVRLREIAPPERHDEDEDERHKRRFQIFTFRADDPTGNSFIQPSGGLSDPKWTKRNYTRSREQEVALGLVEDASTAEAVVPTLTDDMEVQAPEEVFSFPSTCTSCGATLETFMKKVDIPHFKEVMLMSTNCHSCGYRDTEIKSGGAVAEKARKITLQVEDSEDLKRDILKSDTSEFIIPEIGLELNPGTLGGRFTTLEGLLAQVYEELDSRVFARGDSSIAGKGDAMENFLRQLKQAMEAEIQFTVILDDPLANSYIQNPFAPDDDPKMTIELYTRTFQQDEELGLNDIKVEGYGEGEEIARIAAEEAALAEKAGSLNLKS